MAIVFDGVVTPDALTAFVRMVPTPDDHKLTRWLPDRLIPDTEVNFDELVRTNRVAKFRAFDARIPFTSRDVLTTRKAKMPPLSVRNMMGEQERINLERLRNNGTAREPMIRAIYDDGEQLTREIRNRMELARGSVLAGTAGGTVTSAGKLTLNENGLVLEADYGVPSGHKVTPGTAWSTIGSATVVADMTGWLDTYVATNGFPPGGFITTTPVLRNMLQNAEVRTLASSLSGTPARVSRAALDSVLDNFGLPPLLDVVDTVVDVDGVSTRVIPSDRLIFVPPNAADLGMTAWGITATALELVDSASVDFSFEDAPGITGVVLRDGPPFRSETFVDAVGMPVLANPRRILVADVQ
jgi:hypothetical protein